MVAIPVIPIWLLVTGAITCSFGILMARVDLNKVAMRFFRDVARNKARKRLYGNDHALIPMLLGKEESYDSLRQKFQREKEESSDVELINLTLEQLSVYRGQTNDTPIYLSINKRIYDVTAGSKYYGPEGKYHLFTGTDATRAFATGCLDSDDIENCITSSVEGLSKKEIKEIQRWVELYDTHDKYHLVGYLIDIDPVDAVIANANASDSDDASDDGDGSDDES